MRQTEIYGYFAFGYNYGLIKKNGLYGFGRNNAVDLLEGFFNRLQDLDLQVTQRIALDLKDIYVSIKDGADENVSSAQSEKIKAIVERLDPALDAELQLRTAYVLTKKRYALPSLLDTPDELLADGIFQKLSDTAKRDYQLACTQIALSQPTAAAFHLMRALEEQVKVLYFAFKKTNRLQKPMWGPMTQELRSKRPPKPSDKLLSHLDGMRIHFRNPTQHPDAFYNMDEAQDLLNQTITAINMVAAEIP